MASTLDETFAGLTIIKGSVLFDNLGRLELLLSKSKVVGELVVDAINLIILLLLFFFFVVVKIYIIPNLDALAVHKCVLGLLEYSSDGSLCLLTLLDDLQVIFVGDGLRDSVIDCLGAESDNSSWCAPRDQIHVCVASLHILGELILAISRYVVKHFVEFF